RLGDVTAEGAEGGVIRKRRRVIDIARDQQSHRRRLDVAFDAGDLSGEENAVVALCLKRRTQMLRAVDERVAMHRSEARERHVLESGNHLYDALLLRHAHLRLEAD